MQKITRSCLLFFRSSDHLMNMLVFRELSSLAQNETYSRETHGSLIVLSCFAQWKGEVLCLAYRPRSRVAYSGSLLQGTTNAKPFHLCQLKIVASYPWWHRTKMLSEELEGVTNFIHPSLYSYNQSCKKESEHHHHKTDQQKERFI
mgnify:CR=1 FL=1